MRFAFTRDQLLFRDSVRDVLKRECPPDLVRASWDDPRAADGAWKTLAELGVVGLTVPEEYGGMGLGALDGVLLFEELGRFAAPVPLVETTAVAAPLLAALRGEAARTWLPAIAKGDARVSARLGPAAFAADADAASLFLLDVEGAVHVFTKDDVSLAHEPTVDRARRLFRVTLTPGAVPIATASPVALSSAFDRAALATSAELLGLGARMIEMTVEYVKVRKQFGAPIGSFQAVKHHLATAHMRMELARPAVYRAAYSISHDDPTASMHVSMAKACASDAAALAARAALQCHGAIGYSFEHDLHLWMKRAWALAVAWGDAAWHRARVARAVIDGAPSISTGDTP